MSELAADDEARQFGQALAGVAERGEAVEGVLAQLLGELAGAGDAEQAHVGGLVVGGILAGGLPKPEDMAKWLAA